MATLNGKAPKDTYPSLIKTSDNQEMTSEKSLSDGNGNAIPMTVSSTAVGFSGDVKDNNGATGQNGQVLAKTLNGVEWTNRTFEYNQTVSTATWNITHNLGMFPSVSVIDSVGNFVVGNINYIDDRTLEITFKSAFKGKAYLN